MKNAKRLVTVMMILALAGTFSGCAQAPQTERLAAKAAMAAAMAAGTVKYATADFEAARKIWDSSEAQVREKKYQEAKQGYIDARAAFEKATAGVEAGKKVFIDQASAALAELEEGWKNIETAAKKVESKMEKKTLWESDAKTFQEGLKATKNMLSADPAGAIAKAGQLKMFLDSYGAIFKQMAAAPEKHQTVRKKGHNREE
jgi:soluble cytochrome b562